MARPPLPLGTWGSIVRTQEAPNKWKARARYRDFDGHTRLVAKWGKTGAAAERALVADLAGRGRRSQGTVDITPDTRLDALADAWIAKRRAEDSLAAGSLEQYSDIIKVHIKPKLGGVRVGETTVGNLDAFIRGIASASRSRVARIVLSGMMQMAAQHDAIASNPVRDTTRRTPDREETRALTVDELQAFRRRVAAWAGGNDSGPPRGEDLPDLADCFLGSGGRTGEVLAFQRSSIRWATDDAPAMILVTGKIDRHGKFVAAAKSKGSMQWLPMPDFMVAAVKRQLARDLPADELGLLFPSRSGGPRQPGNVRRQLREARETVVFDEGGQADGPADRFSWVSPKTFRKTVATIIEAEQGMEAAAGQLGHSSPEITRLHYVQRSKVAADQRAALDALAPVSGQ